jgi:Tetratricopeptide repeat
VQNTSPDPTPDPEASPGSEPDSPSLAAPLGGTPEVWGTVPSRNRLFTGREELLKQLRDGLTTSRLAAVVPYAVHGLGGVGKTQIAIEYAYRYQEFYDVVWWIRCDEESLIESSIAALAPRLNLPSVGVGLEESAAAVLDALRLGKPYSRWLLIFDAAAGPESIRRFLVNRPGHTLVTSRNPNWEDVADTVHIKVFSRTESSQFLGRRVPGIEEKDSDALAEALGDLPLALDQAGALQVEAGMPVPEYLALLEARASDVLRQAKAGGYPVPVALAWKVSMGRLKEAVPEAIELLTCCAFFGPQPIPREVLRGGRDVVTESLGSILRDPILFSKAVSSLNRYSLVSVEVPQRSIQVHRLVQALTREDLSSQDRERFQHDVHRLLAKATPRDPDDSSTWPRFVELLPHYGPARMIACHDSDVRLSIRSVIRYQYMAGGFHAALELADSALEQWSQDPDAAPTDLLAVKRHRGTVLRALGRYHDAFEVNAASVAEATEELGPGHDETLRVTNSHGADIRAAGDFRAAYALDADSVSRHIAAFGDRDRRTLRAKNNFALDQALMGEFKEARELHNQVYQLGQEIYGSENHPSVLSSLNNLARDVRLCGEYSEAYFMAEDNYAACRNNLGPAHPVTLRAARDLVIAERLAVGGTEETVERAVDILAQHKKRHGDSHPATLAAATALVNAWREASNLDDAIPLAEHSTNLAREVYGPDHPLWYASRGNLALVLRLSGDAPRARELHETSVDRLNVLLGADHHYTLTCAMGLASDQAASRDLPGAQSRGQDTLDRIRNVLWPDHPMTLACTINLSLDLRAMGREAEANQLRSDALERYAHTLGNNHPATLAAFDGKRLDFDFDPPPV